MSSLIWYAAGNCGYWTDDFSKLKIVGPGIPCCPKCSAVGFQMDKSDWDSGAEKFQEKRPRYIEFLNSIKETCDSSKTVMKKYEAFVSETPKPPIQSSSPPCRVCKKPDEVICYPDDHSQTVCPECCDKATHADGEEGHVWEYERPERRHICKYCGIPRECTAYEDDFRD